MKYRKKPVVVEAHQWWKNGDHPLDGESNIEGELVRYFRRPEPEYSGERIHNCGHRWHEHGWIDTLEGGHTVCPGDFIIRGVRGEFYPCKPDIFVATYEEEPAGTNCAESGTATTTTLAELREVWYERNQHINCDPLTCDCCAIRCAIDHASAIEHENAELKRSRDLSTEHVVAELERELAHLRVDRERLRVIGTLLSKMLEALPWGAYKGALMEDGDIKAAINAAKGKP